MYLHEYICAHVLDDKRHDLQDSPVLVLFASRVFPKCHEGTEARSDRLLLNFREWLESRFGSLQAPYRKFMKRESAVHAVGDVWEPIDGFQLSGHLEVLALVPRCVEYLTVYFRNGIVDSVVSARQGTFRVFVSM